MNRTICILYGITEGRATGRRLIMALERAGFTTIGNPVEANIIFAHSGGCLLIPPQSQAQLVLMVGLPYWPGRPWLAATIVKVWREWKVYHQRHASLQWARKLGCHIRYAGNFKAAAHMAANLGTDKPWNSKRSQIIIRNRYDVYCSPGVPNIPFKGPRTFISLPGEHDDCWDNPGPYVDLLQSLLRD